jgi:hypothetical protein
MANKLLTADPASAKATELVEQAERLRAEPLTRERVLRQARKVIEAAETLLRARAGIGGNSKH